MHASLCKLRSGKQREEESVFLSDLILILHGVVGHVIRIGRKPAFISGTSVQKDALFPRMTMEIAKQERLISRLLFVAQMRCL